MDSNLQSEKNFTTTLPRTTLGTGLARTGTNTQVHHGSRLSDSCEDGEALSSVHPPTPATGKLIHHLLCDCRMKNDRDTLLLQPQPILSGPSHLIEVLGPRQLVL